MIRKKTFIAVILTIVLSSIVSLGQERNLIFRKLTVDQGLSHTDATSILQDKKGYIWIGTFGGLDRYDGYEVKNFLNKKEGLKNAFFNRINYLQLVGEDHLWIGSEGGIRIFDLQTETFIKPTVKDVVIDELHEITSLFIANDVLYIIDINKKAFAYEISGPGQLSPVETGLSELKFVKGFSSGLNSELYCLSEGDVYTSLDGKVFTKLIIQKTSNENIGFFIRVDEVGNLWLSQGEGLLMVDALDLNSKSNSALVAHFIEIRSETGNRSSISERWNINDVLTESNGISWVASSEGLFKIRNRLVVDFFEPQDKQENSLTSNFLTSLLLDKSGIFWISSFAGGVTNVDFSTKKFSIIKREPNKANTLSGFYVRAICEDPQGNLWIGTQNNGLNIYSPKNQSFKLVSGLATQNIRAVIIDSKNKVWVASDRGIDILNLDGSHYDFIGMNSDPLKSLTNPVIYTLAEDVFGRIWAGSWEGGLSIIDYQSKGDFSVQQYLQKDGLAQNRVTFIYADPRRLEVLVSTTNGLNHFYLNEKGDIKDVFCYQGVEGDDTKLTSNYIWPVVRQNENSIWVGTIGGGFCNLKLEGQGNYSCECFTEEDGLPSNDVEGILLDESGDVWLSGKGITHYEPETKSFQVYDVNDGLQGNSFKIGSSTKGKNGRLYFGGINGLNFFNPKEISKNNFEAKVQITDLLVNNRPYEIGQVSSKTIAYTEQIDLKDDQNNFVFSFSALHFANPKNCLYRYKLEGFENEWVYTNAQNRNAAFSNLEYGEYTFIVEASNNDAVWSGNETALVINVLPPWYKSAWAKILWLLLAAGFAYAVYTYQKRMFGLKRQLEWQQLEEKKAEELHKFRMQFFTNISHDFRTPLSLILGPLENLLNEKLDFTVRENYYQIIQRNAQRLLSLINELMDFQKVELGTVKLKTTPSNIGVFVREIASEFYDLAQRKDITFSVAGDSAVKNVWFDRHVLEKILVNLLSNAFKYTEANGAVEVEVLKNLEGFKPVFEVSHEIKNEFRAEEYFYIRIADTGIGISEPSLKYIFERYFRISDSDKDKHLGSGVGLALVKSMVFLHKGDVLVSSKRNLGTEFVLGFPAREEDYESENFEALQNSSKSSKLESGSFAIESADDSDIDILESGSNGLKKSKILVAEDNDEMQAFIVQLLKDKYDVIITSNGAEAYEKAKSIAPDLILSDVMMPIMDGNELCAKVKTDIALSHIPFILLTAKQSEDSQITGTESGADSYLTKPFSPKLLNLTISNLLDNRQKLRQWYSQNYFAEARELATNKKDEDFINQLSTFVEKNVENTDLDIELICKELGMSRTNLYNKIKGITGESIGEFIRDFKLKKAAKLLLEEDIAVVQAMYQVGIQSQSYFTKAFKKKFGKTPTAFVKSYTKE